MADTGKRRQVFLGYSEVNASETQTISDMHVQWVWLSVGHAAAGKLAFADHNQGSLYLFSTPRDHQDHDFWLETQQKTTCMEGGRRVRKSCIEMTLKSLKPFKVSEHTLKAPRPFPAGIYEDAGYIPHNSYGTISEVPSIPGLSNVPRPFFGH